jgi:hypothetical protein
MREAGAPSTKELPNTVRGVVPAPPRIDMVASPKIQRNTEREHSEGRAKSEEWDISKKRSQGQYKGRIPVELQPWRIIYALAGRSCISYRGWAKLG